MQDYSYIYVSGMELTNTGLHSVHIIQNNPELLPGCLPSEYIPVKSRMQHFF